MIPALGRPFKLGDFYHLGTNKIVIGTGWKQSILEYPQKQLMIKSGVSLVDEHSKFRSRRTITEDQLFGKKYLYPLFF